MEASILFPEIQYFGQIKKEKKISRSKRRRLVKKMKRKALSSHQGDLVTELGKDLMKSDSAVQRSDGHHLVEEETAMKARRKPEFFSYQGAPPSHGDEEAAMRQRLANSVSLPILITDSLENEIDTVGLGISPSDNKESVSTGHYNLRPHFRL